MKNYEFLKPFTFKNGVTLRNKAVMAPMTIMASFFNGMVSSDEIEYYRERAGGVGMLITAVAYVSPGGIGFDGELSAASDDMVESLRSLATAIKSKGAKAILQVFHAGRKSLARMLSGVQPVSASAVKAEWPEYSEMPRELRDDEIKQIILDFGQAVRRAIEAGFDGVELHGANTYLLQQFFSPHSNRRTDHWGGDRDKRMNFARAVIKESQRVIKEYAKTPFILGYRISPEEVETPGIRLEDSLYFVHEIKHEVDYIHLSLTNYKQSSLNNKEDTKPLVQYFVEEINHLVPLISVGQVIKGEDADDALKVGADLIAVGLELLIEPKWVEKVSAGEEEKMNTPTNFVHGDMALPTVTQAVMFPPNKKSSLIN